MKRRPFLRIVTAGLALVLSLTGCSRTVDDIARWKAKGSVEKLIKALGDPKMEVRQAAAGALGELKAEPAVDPLAALYNDPEAAVTLAAVEALASIGTPATVTPLIAALKLDAAEARLIAAKALGEQAASGATEALAEALNDTEESVQVAAAVSLGQIGEEQSGQALSAKLNASSEKLRLACVESLGLTGGSVAARGLINALDDQSAAVRKAAVESLAAVGEPAKPVVLKALQHVKKPVRQGALQVLKKLEAIPTTGSDAIWYQLARVSVDNADTINEDLARKLASKGIEEVDTLLEAAAHEVVDFREHAILALEYIGEPCTAQAMETAEQTAGRQAEAWFKNRTTWAGAPDWRLDLWGAAAALSPAFELDSTTAANLQQQGRSAFSVLTAPGFKPTRSVIPSMIALLGDRTVPAAEQPSVDADGIPIVRQARDMFRGEANQQMAMEQLKLAGRKAVFPLIAALSDPDALVAGHAAEVLGEIGDTRAVEPLMNVLKQKISEDEVLSNSPFYTALQVFKAPEAEPILLKIRPNSDRAMHVFERQYAGVRAMSAESRDASSDYRDPITYRIGYIDRGMLKELEITFRKDGFGDWKPAPALPDQLP